MEKKSLVGTVFAGIKLPTERGGDFLHGSHIRAQQRLLDSSEYILGRYLDNDNPKFTDEDDENRAEIITDPKTGQVFGKCDDLVLSGKDIQAFECWYNDNRHDFYMLINFKGFAISYYNAAYVGSNVNYSDRWIKTADFTPHITFEPWIKNGYDIGPLCERLDYDEAKKKLFKIEAGLIQMRANDRKRRDLEQITGRTLYDPYPFLGQDNTGGRIYKD